MVQDGFVPCTLPWEQEELRGFKETEGLEKTSGRILSNLARPTQLSTWAGPGLISSGLQPEGGMLREEEEQEKEEEEKGGWQGEEEE
jgi:hypothetical protein